MHLTSQDWFIPKFKNPAFTNGISPYVGETVVPLSYWPQQKSVGLLAAKEISAVLF